MWALAVAAYVALAAACTAVGKPLPAAAALAALLTAGSVRAAAARQWASAAYLALNLALVLAVLFALGPRAALSLTLVVAQAAVSAVFFRSLRRGRTDVVTQIAVAVHPERSVRALAYTRGVSIAWAGFMGMLAALSLVFTFTAPVRLWWWWTNVGSIGLPVAFFAAEWTVRQFVLPREEKPGFRRTVRALRHVDYKRIFQP